MADQASMRGRVALSEGEIEARRREAFNNARRERLRQVHQLGMKLSVEAARARKARRESAERKKKSNEAKLFHEAEEQRAWLLTRQREERLRGMGEAHEAATQQADAAAQRRMQLAEKNHDREVKAWLNHSAAVAHENRRLEQVKRPVREAKGRLRAFEQEAMRQRRQLKNARDDGKWQSRNSTAGSMDLDGLWASLPGGPSLDRMRGDWMSVFSETRLHELCERRGGGAGPTPTVAGSLGQAQAAKNSGKKGQSRVQRWRAKERAKVYLPPSHHFSFKGEREKED